jgi:anthranilate synthase component 1
LILFIITHINPDTQNYEDAQVRLDEISNKIQAPYKCEQYQSDNLTEQDFVSSFGEDNYKATVEKIQQYIVAGDVMQVVPSHTSMGHPPYLTQATHLDTQYVHHNQRL